MKYNSWETVRLGDVCDYENSRVSIAMLDDDNYISTENMQPNKGGVCRAGSLPSVSAATKFLKGQTLVSNIRPYFKKIWFADKDGGCSNDVLCFRLNKDINNKYFYYLLSQDSFFDYVMSGSKGTKMPRGDRGQIMQFEFMLPSLVEQERIAGILGALDDKIECNNRINRNLEEQAAALFRRWFVDFEFPDPDPTSPTYGKPYRSSGGEMTDSPLGEIPKGWREGTLLEIANYLNGLAMQKFRPQEGEQGIPVLKIKELGQGKCDSSSDLCSESIKEDYIINDGDIVFSWSGTLMTDIWCGGKCGLNQHLFKVTSNLYPKWFDFQWTKYHLDKFIRIAKDKAVTMGHIKREDLQKSSVLIPDSVTLDKMNELMSPLLAEQIALSIENRTLTELRDTLLPKLMNNEI